MPCPRCGSAAAVHAITEMADMARQQLSQAGQIANAARPRDPKRGWEAEPQAGPLPGPGYSGAASAAPMMAMNSLRAQGRNLGNVPDSIGDVIGGVAAGFIGRAVANRAQQAMAQRVNAVQGRMQPMLETQIAIAEKYPEIRACTSDHVVFLDGGRSVLPMPNLTTLTLEQADAMVAQLRGT
jgi:hypothetical protein